MAKFVSREKLSKKAQKELDNQKRTVWAFSPTTKKVESKKLYNRRKSAHAWKDDFGMYQCQAEIAARDLLHRAGGGLQDAQAVTSPCCGVGFIDTDHRRSPPSKGYKESASEETLLQVEK